MVVAIVGGAVAVQAGGFANALYVLGIAITGESSIGWALAGSRVFGVVMVILIVLAIWRMPNRRRTAENARLS